MAGGRAPVLARLEEERRLPRGAGALLPAESCAEGTFAAVTTLRNAELARERPELALVSPTGERSQEFVCPNNAVVRASIREAVETALSRRAGGVLLEGLSTPPFLSPPLRGITCACRSCEERLQAAGMEIWALGLEFERFEKEFRGLGREELLALLAGPGEEMSLGVDYAMLMAFSLFRRSALGELLREAKALVPEGVELAAEYGARGADATDIARTCDWAELAGTNTSAELGELLASAEALAEGTGLAPDELLRARLGGYLDSGVELPESGRLRADGLPSTYVAWAASRAGERLGRMPARAAIGSGRAVEDARAAARAGCEGIVLRTGCECDEEVIAEIVAAFAG